jgi:hypothetical protein
MPRPRLTAAALAVIAGAALLPIGAWAQAPAPAPTAPSPSAAPPTATAPRPRAEQPRRPAVSTLSWSQMDERQRRLAQRSLATPGAAPLSTEQAQQRWDGMSRAERHRALDAARAARQQQRQERQGSTQPRPARPRTAEPASPAAPAPGATPR